MRTCLVVPRMRMKWAGSPLLGHAGLGTRLPAAPLELFSSKCLLPSFLIRECPFMTSKAPSSLLLRGFSVEGRWQGKQCSRCPILNSGLCQKIFLGCHRRITLSPSPFPLQTGLLAPGTNLSGTEDSGSLEKNRETCHPAHCNVSRLETCSSLA